jgi:hypothetical protein
MAYVVVACMGALVGLALGLVIASKSDRKFAAGYAFLGLAAGLVVGLSNSPVVASGITAGFALVASLLPYYVTEKAATRRRDGAAVSSLPPVGSWLAPLSCMIIVGVLLGITIRVNELLFVPNPTPHVDLRSQYSAMGFSEPQIDRIMKGHADALAGAAPGRSPEPLHPKSPVAVLTAAGIAQVRQVLADAEGFSDPDKRLDFIVNHAPMLKEEVARLRAAGKPPDEILELLRKSID